MEKDANDLKKAIEFIKELDGIKNIFRQTKIIGGERFENDAEHSWHICMMAYTLHSFFDGAQYGINVARAVKMLLLHDVVELYAGDTYCYNEAANADKYEREMDAAKKIFGLLPKSMEDEFMALWLEFDCEKTNDAVFASIMDKIQPLILNHSNKGESWIANGITRTQVMKRMDIALKKSPPVLRDYLLFIIEDSVEKDWLKNE